MKRNKKKHTTEFSKHLLHLDYAFFGVLLVLTILFPDIDFITLDAAWTAQLGISTTAYYVKTKSDNRIKVPINVIKSLPRSMRKDLDLTQVIVAIIQSD